MFLGPGPGYPMVFIAHFSSVVVDHLLFPFSFHWETRVTPMKGVLDRLAN